MEPLETEFGRKRRINQSSCNKDYSCANGFCPSFVTIEDAKLVKAKAATIDTTDLPEPSPPSPGHGYNIMVTGIGGTGVLTVSALLGTAAHLQGLASTTADMAGLAQKGGAVYAHVRIGQHNSDLLSPRIMAGCADLVLACDAVVAADKPTQSLMTSGRTAVIANANIAPTADFVRNRDFDFQSRSIERTVRQAARPNATQFLEAARVATALLGDSIGANLLLLGAARQQGHVPLTRASLEAAIRLNNVAVDFNLRAFALGRLLAHDPQKVEAMIAATNPVPQIVPSRSIDELIEQRAADLTAYQNELLAVRYRALISKARATGGDDLADAVARSYHKLLAYKDEYEVARLYSDGRFAATMQAQFQSGTPHVWLAPPFLSKTDPATGRPAKRKFGPWIFTAFKLLARFKTLRGTALDPFGRTEERRHEREDIIAYEAEIERLLAELTPDRLPLAISIARLPLDVRGFGPVKAEARTRVAAERAALWARWAPQNSAKAA